MVRKIKSDDFYWGNEPAKKESKLVDIAKRKAHLVLKESTFVYCEARFLVSKLSKEEVSPKAVQQEALFHSIDRYDSQGRGYLAKRAVDLMQIRDPVLTIAILDRVTEELKKYSTRQVYINAVADKMKEISKRDLVNGR